MRANAAWPSEARLLLDCARLELNEGERARIEAALAAAIDWPLVLRLAHRHGLRPLLHRHLGALDAGRVPRAVIVELWGEAASIAQRNAVLARELGRIARLLESHGIRVVPYKGPTLALAAYADLSMREFGDLDLLLAREDVPRARDLLCDCGYVPEYPLAPGIEAALLESRLQYHLVVRSRAQGHPVELHWKTDPDFPVERLDDAAWWDGMGHVTVQGEALRTLAPEELLLVLCLHGAKHRWESLGWLVDVAELLRRGGALDWDRIARRARELDCPRRAGLGLHLANALLDAPLPSGAESLAGARGIEALGQRLLRGLFDDAMQASHPLADLRSNLVLFDRAGQGIRHAARVAASPSLVEWTRWPLPTALFFLYPPMRLGRLAGKHLRRCTTAVLRRAKLHP